MRKIVIQAKRYKCPVGNHAVQEVVAAIRFYRGAEGMVVTNSTFTSSARALAEKNDVTLIDGTKLSQLHTTCTAEHVAAKTAKESATEIESLKARLAELTSEAARTTEAKGKGLSD